MTDITLVMFSIPPLLLLLLLSTQTVAALEALETINPTLVTNRVNVGASPLNSTALRDADASAQASSLADGHHVDSSHPSVLSPPRHANHYENPNQSRPIPASDTCSRNTTIGAIENVEYKVPGTEITLRMSFRRDRPIERKAMGGFLLLMRDQVQAHISASGDGSLLPQDDPYRRNWPGLIFRNAQSDLVADGRVQGFYFISKSSPLPGAEGDYHHLTYGIMDSVLEGEAFLRTPSLQPLNCLCTGLFDIMYTGAPDVGPLPFSCRCYIEDDTKDLVGTAMVWAAPMTVEDI